MLNHIFKRLEHHVTIPIVPYKKKEDLYAAQKKHRIKVRQEILNFLKGKECIDCGEDDPIVLDFDHINPNSKFKSVAKMLSGHYSWRSVHDEIVKCEIRCANCHRRKTYKQLNCFGKTPL